MNAAEATKSLGRVREKLERLRSAGKSKSLFGAKSLEVRLGRPLSKEELQEREGGFWDSSSFAIPPILERDRLPDSDR